MANKTGIVSISFRDRSPEQILTAASEAGLDAVEWGGDVHVPHGDLEAARLVRELSAAFDTEIAEYGSYYAIGKSDPSLFEDILNTARDLGTNVIRVWAHQGKASDSFSEEEYQACVADAKRICAMAGDITVALECHPNTLTDEYHTELKFIRDVGCDNLGINLDPANLIMYGKGNPVDALDVFGKYVREIHGKDGKYPTNGKNLGCETRIGEGKVDYPRFIAKLKEIGFDGNIIIEREISGEEQKRDILESTALLRELIGE